MGAAACVGAGAGAFVVAGVVCGCMIVGDGGGVRARVCVWSGCGFLYRCFPFFFYLLKKKRKKYKQF